MRKLKTPLLEEMESLQKELLIQAPVEKVFSFMDDLSKTGMHMSGSSMMMAGSKLKLEHVSGPEKGVGAGFRWSGKMLGFELDFTVVVTKWVENAEKVWETIGMPKLIILGWYLMHLKTEPVTGGTLVSLEIQYIRPRGFFYKLLSILFARRYAEWCVTRMLNDSKKSLEGSGD